MNPGAGENSVKNVIEALKSQPWTLALLIISLGQLFLLAYVAKTSTDRFMAVVELAKIHKSIECKE